MWLIGHGRSDDLWHLLDEADTGGAMKRPPTALTLHRSALLGSRRTWGLVSLVQVVRDLATPIVRAAGRVNVVSFARRAVPQR